MTVHAKGNNYAGHTSYTYKILKAENNLSSAAVQFKDGDKTVKSITKEYTGEAVTLNKEDLAVTMKVKENGKTVTVTVESENYEIVGYTNNVNKGTAKVTIRGIGAFGGEKTVSFKIAQKTVREFHWTEIFSTIYSLVYAHLIAKLVNRLKHHIASKFCPLSAYHILSFQFSVSHNILPICSQSLHLLSFLMTNHT